MGNTRQHKEDTGETRAQRSVGAVQVLRARCARPNWACPLERVRVQVCRLRLLLLPAPSHRQRCQLLHHARIAAVLGGQPPLLLPHQLSRRQLSHGQAALEHGAGALAALRAQSAAGRGAQVKVHACCKLLPGGAGAE